MVKTSRSARRRKPAAPVSDATRCIARPRRAASGASQSGAWLMSKAKIFAALLVALVALPAAAEPVTYSIDPTHTYPSLEFSHMGLSVWRGKFDKTSGSITLDRAAKTGTVNVVVQVSSIDFGLKAMDEKARSDDFFNVDKF